MTTNSEKFEGKLIAVEGLDGSGKSTQVYLLKRWLQEKNVNVFFTEWNSSFLVKKATSKAKKRQLLTPTTFSLIHATDFADRYERQIVPLLKGGYVVLCDRYIYTAYARDITRGCDPLWVKNLYDFAVVPDITFYFKVPLQIALDRISQGRPNLKYFEAGMDLNLSTDIQESFKRFQSRILDQYEAMAKKSHFQTIDATASIESQQEIVRALVSKTLDLDHFKKQTAIVRHSLKRMP